MSELFFLYSSHDSGFPLLFKATISYHHQGCHSLIYLLQPYQLSFIPIITDCCAEIILLPHLDRGSQAILSKKIKNNYLYLLTGKEKGRDC